VGRHGAVPDGRARRLNRRRARRDDRLRAVAIAAVVGTALFGVGAGAFAAFFDSETVSVTVGSGDVGVEWASSGSAALTVPVASILPAQSTERLVELHNTGSIPVSELQLVVAAANANNSDGLQLAISDCSVPWSGTTTFTCAGVETVVSADRPLRATIALPALSSTEPGGRDYLRLVFRLPSSAPSTLQGATTNVTFEILGNQRTGQNR
jgi:hypothetical protein